VVGCWRGCLGRGADLHIAQQMPLPLTISCSSKSRLVLPFLVLPFCYVLTRVVLDKFQKSSKMVVGVCVRFSHISWPVVLPDCWKWRRDSAAECLGPAMSRSSCTSCRSWSHHTQTAELQHTTETTVTFTSIPGLFVMEQAGTVFWHLFQNTGISGQ